jgi:hypothetical protein
MGLSYMTGAAVATMIAVAVGRAAALTLLPALLGYLGPHVDRLRSLRPRRTNPLPPRALVQLGARRPAPPARRAGSSQPPCFGRARRPGRGPALRLRPTPATTQPDS